MIRFSVTIQKFSDQGEKTGWTYIPVTEEQANKLLPGQRKSFRVKGRLDEHPYQLVSLTPMGDGSFIMTLNAAMRKAIGKQKGATLRVEMDVDQSEIKLPAALMECLADEPKALARFTSLPKSHRNYYGNWINSAKTEPTKAKRIAATIDALLKGLDFGAMIRAMRDDQLF